MEVFENLLFDSNGKSIQCQGLHDSTKLKKVTWYSASHESMARGAPYKFERPYQAPSGLVSQQYELQNYANIINNLTHHNLLLHITLNPRKLSPDYQKHKSGTY